MTIVQLFITYAVCWWMVLFMVLPYRAHASEKPSVGLAASAPANPRIKKKLFWTTCLALLPALLLYFWANAAHADDIYHAGNKRDCNPLKNYQAPAGVNATDGTGSGDKKLAPATLGGNSKILGAMDKVSVGLNIPSQKYLEPQLSNPPTVNADGSITAPTANHNVDLSRSDIQMGSITVGQDGSATLNGETIGGQNVRPEGCEE
jgi:predicted secreted protein